MINININNIIIIGVVGLVVVVVVVAIVVVAALMCNNLDNSPMIFPFGLRGLLYSTLSYIYISLYLASSKRAHEIREGERNG